MEIGAEQAENSSQAHILQTPGSFWCSNRPVDISKEQDFSVVNKKQDLLKLVQVIQNALTFILSSSALLTSL